MDVVWFLIGEFPILWTNCSVCSLERRRNNRGKSWGGAGLGILGGNSRDRVGAGSGILGKNYRGRVGGRFRNFA